MRKQQVLDRARDLVLPVLANLGYELVEVDLVVARGRRTLRVFIHRKGGVSLDGCATVSKAIGPLIDSEDMFPGRYYLEVSSPGAERKLRTRDDFRIFVGSKARIRMKAAGDRQRDVEGLIEDFCEDVVTVRQKEGNSVEIPLEEIFQASLCL